MTYITNDHTNTHTRPWWREPWPWLLMAGPLLAMMGCAVTIALAVAYFRGQAIVDDGGLKRGLVIEKRGTPTVQEKMGEKSGKQQGKQQGEQR